MPPCLAAATLASPVIFVPCRPGDGRSQNASVRRVVLVAVLLSVGFFILGVGAYLVAPVERQGREKCFLEERDRFTETLPAYSWSRTLWPPAIRCTYHEAGRDDVTIVKPLGSGSWVPFALSCAAAGTIAVGVQPHM